MFAKNFRTTLALPLLCAAALLGSACDKTPESNPEPTEIAQPEKPFVADTPEPSKNTENTINSDNEPATPQANPAELRDQFLKEARSKITVENAENVLSEIEAELNEELAELEQERTPPPAKQAN